MTGFVFQGHIYGISDTGSVRKLLMLAQRATPRPYRLHFLTIFELMKNYINACYYGFT